MSKDAKNQYTNDRQAYICRERDGNPYYKRIVFMDLKPGDKFFLTEPDGCPVPNRDGSVVAVATEMPTVSEYGVEGIMANPITRVALELADSARKIKIEDPEKRDA